MTFRLTTLLWAFAVVAASLAVFGGWGVMVAGGVIWTWVQLPRTSGPWKSWIVLLVVLAAFLGFLWAMLMPVVAAARASARLDGAHADLRALGAAIQSYYVVHGHYPPPYVADQSGLPMYSWRVLVLPYLGQQTIHDKFRLDEPWDSPHNSRFIRNLEEFQSTYPNSSVSRTGETHYFAVVGHETAWNPNRLTKLGDIADGASNTLLLVEQGGSSIVWSEPRDLSLNEAIDVLTGASPAQTTLIERGYFVSRCYSESGFPWRGVVFADGRIESFRPMKNSSDAEAILTIADGEIYSRDYEVVEVPYSRKLVRTIIHWGRIWGIVLWLGLTLLPAWPTARRKIFPPKGELKEYQRGRESVLEAGLSE